MHIDSMKHILVWSFKATLDESRRFNFPQRLLNQLKWPSDSFPTLLLKKSSEIDPYPHASLIPKKTFTNDLLQRWLIDPNWDIVDYKMFQEEMSLYFDVQISTVKNDTHKNDTEESSSYRIIIPQRICDFLELSPKKKIYLIWEISFINIYSEDVYNTLIKNTNTTPPRLLLD